MNEHKRIRTSEINDEIAVVVVDVDLSVFVEFDDVVDDDVEISVTSLRLLSTTNRDQSASIITIYTQNEIKFVFTKDDDTHVPDCVAVCENASSMAKQHLIEYRSSDK